MSETKDRLLQFLKYKDLGQQKFEISIGMSNGWASKVGDSIRENTLQKIKEVYPELNIAWLKSGVGEMLNNTDQEPRANGTEEISNLINRVCFTLGIRGKELAERLEMSPGYLSDIKNGNKPVPENFTERLIAMLPVESGHNTIDNEGTLSDRCELAAKLVPLLPIAAQGGSLNDFVASVKDSDCEFVVSPVKGADFAMPICGDSMAPEYPNGSQILIKKINESAFIEWGKVYVLDTCNGVVVKILVPSEKEGYVKCLSINKDPIFAPFEVSWSNIYGVYRVLMCMSVK